LWVWCERCGDRRNLFLPVVRNILLWLRL